MAAFTAYTILDGTSTPQSVQFFTTPGQTTSALSMPVVIAADQSAIPVSQSGTWNANSAAGIIGSAPPTSGSYTAWNNGGTLAGTALTTPMPIGFAGSYFTASSVNSSTVQLAASATFTGAVETIYNQAAISVLLTSDQPGALTLNQYIDAAGTRLAQSTTITNLANVPISRALGANGNYFRASYQNTGAGTTTTFQLDVAYGYLEPQTSLGNLPVALQEYNGAALSSGNPLPVSAAQSGTWTFNQTAGAAGFEKITDGTNTAAVKAASTAAVATDPALVVAISPNNTVAAAQSGTWNVGLSTGTNNVGTFGNTQGSSTSGQSGPLTQGAVTTAAPSYTTAQTSPLSLTTGGGLRGDVASYAGTALTGTVTAYGTAPTGNVFGVNAAITSGTLTTVTTVTTVSTVTSLSQIAASVPQMNIANGSTNKELGVSIATAITQTDLSAVALAGAGRVNGTVIASAAGSGCVISAEINVSVLTLGTASSVFITLQESTGGTNFTDIWVSDPITATGIVRVPAIYVAGRRRWSAFSVGGTSTTVTTTITTLELPPGGNVFIRQMRDAFSATNPFALLYNTAALTASNFVLTTLSTATTPFNLEGTKVWTAFMLLAGGPTVTTQPVVSVQGSMDGTNWATISGSTMTAAGNGLYSVTVNGTAFKFGRLIVTTAAVYGSGSYTITSIGVNAVN